MSAVETLAEAALYAYLIAHATVGPLIGDERCYPEILPQDDSTVVLDAIVMHNIGTSGVSSHSGLSGVDSPRYQLDCLSATFAGAKTLALAVRKALDGAAGTWGGVPVRAVVYNDMHPLGYFEDTKTHKVAVDVTLWHE